MIIPNHPESYSYRYLPRLGNRALALFFPTANVAYRRSALQPLNYFDESFRAGEDTDAGIRLARRGELFSTPSARVVHTADLSLLKLLGQWWRIAVYTVRVLRKHVGPGIEVFVRLGGLLDGEARWRNVYYREMKLPFTATVFISPFLLLNLGIWLSLLSSGGPFVLGFTFIAGWLYFRNDIDAPGLTLRHKLAFALLRFAINLILLYVSFIEGLRQGLLYVNHGLDTPRA